MPKKPSHATLPLNPTIWTLISDYTLNSCRCLLWKTPGPASILGHLHTAWFANPSIEDLYIADIISDIKVFNAYSIYWRGRYQFLTDPPPSGFYPNAHSAFVNGSLITDTLCTWIKSHFVCGPFNKPPFADFLCNPLQAVPQKEKVRPVLNLSHPKGQSFNDALSHFHLPKPVMTSAHIFSLALFSAGRNTVFSKFDMKSAYKNIPQHPSLWRAQGFSWLGKYFCDISTVFGSTAAPYQFDFFASTIQFLATFLCSMQPDYLFRQLDDLIALSPAYSSWSRIFTEVYSSLCNRLNIKLAADCPDKQKAFKNSTEGLVLDIWFDSKTMTWSLPEEKISRYIIAIDSVLSSPSISLRSLQAVLGFINDFAIFSLFFKAFKFPLHYFLRQFRENDHILLSLPPAAKQDLCFYREAMQAALHGLPLSKPTQNPPFSALSFFSDAAAGVFPLYEKLPHLFPSRGGVSFGGQFGDFPWCAAQLIWPPSLLSSAKSSEGKFFGDKSSTLEIIALCLPLLCFPQQIYGRHVCFFTDNQPLFFGWGKDTCWMILLTSEDLANRGWQTSRCGS